MDGQMPPSSTCSGNSSIVPLYSFPSNRNVTGILSIECELITIHDLRQMKGRRYDNLRDMLQIGAIRKFSNIFTWVPKTIIRQHIGTSSERINKLTENPSDFKLREIYEIAKLIGYDPKKLLLMAAEEMDSTQKENPDAPH